MAITMVQAPAPTIVPTVTSSTIVFGSNVQAGNTLVVFGRAASLADTGISDNLANSGSWAVLATLGTGNDKRVWAKQLLVGGPMTVTVSGASGTIRIAAYEYSGATATLGCTPVTVLGSLLTTLTVGPTTSVGMGNLVICGWGGGGATDTITAGAAAPNSDFTSFSNASGSFSMEDNVNWAGGPATGTMTRTLTGAADGFILALYPILRDPLSFNPIPFQAQGRNF